VLSVTTAAFAGSAAFAYSSSTSAPDVSIVITRQPALPVRSSSTTLRMPGSTVGANFLSAASNRGEDVKRTPGRS
jgi:hypothetical protein